VTRGPSANFVFEDFLKFNELIFKPSRKVEWNIKSSPIEEHRIKALERGSWLFQTPFGLERIYNGKTVNVVPNKDAAIVIMIFNLRYVENLSFSKISKLTAKAGKKVPISSVRNILRNPLYKGELRCNGRVFEKQIEPLISKEIFDSVQCERKIKQSDNFSLNKFIRVGHQNGEFLSGSLLRSRRVYRSASSEHPIIIVKSECYIKELFINLIAQRVCEIAFNYQKNISDIYSWYNKLINKITTHMSKERQLTISQLSQIDELHPKFKFLETRKHDAMEQINAWKEFQDCDCFAAFLSSALDLSIRWDDQNVNVQREIQRILFPEGVFYDIKGDTLIPFTACRPGIGLAVKVI
jgi:hypothetical protein